MIRKTGGGDLARMLDYIGDERGKCLYLYLDILKYGLDSQEVQLWEQVVDGGTECLAMRYRNGVHVYSCGVVSQPGEIAEFIGRLSPTMVCGEGALVRTLSAGFPGYSIEDGIVSRLEADKTGISDKDVRRARPEDFIEIAKMLKDDEGYGAPFTLEELEFQFRSRQDSGLARSYVLDIGGEVVAHAATAAECDDLTTLNGFVVRLGCRRRGYATRVVSALCADLQAEGKEVYSAYYVEASANLHRKLGFVKYCDWAKLFRRV